MAAAWSTRIGWLPRPEKVLVANRGTVGRLVLPQHRGSNWIEAHYTPVVPEEPAVICVDGADFLAASSNRRSMAAF